MSITGLLIVYTPAAVWIPVAVYLIGVAKAEGRDDSNLLISIPLSVAWIVVVPVMIFVVLPLQWLYRLGQRRAQRARLRAPKTIEDLLDEENRR